MPESYQPGHRQRKLGVNHQIQENRFAWVQVENMKYLILVGNEEKSESGPDVVLFRPMAGRLPDHVMNLTNLTEPELMALKELFDSAFEWALPVVKLRDKEANDAYEQGDDSYIRSYRAVPTVVYRKRPQFEYREGVLDGSEDVSPSVGSRGTDLDGGVRGAGSGMAEHDPNESEPEDYGTSID
jgi:hypothetical protein